MKDVMLFLANILGYKVMEKPVLNIFFVNIENLP
jgi:hypothetical protein